MSVELRSLAGSVAFAAVAGAGFLLGSAILARIGLGPLPLDLYGLAVAACYATAVAAPRRRRAAGVLALVLATASLAVVRDAWDVAWTSAVIVGMVRGSLGPGPRSLRRFGLEAATGVASVIAAAFVWSPGSLGTALAIWLFYLVQGTLTGLGETRTSPPAAAEDPFVRARRKLERLLDDDPLVFEEPDPVAR